jgi:tRNA-splicing ligase RtcB
MIAVKTKFFAKDLPDNLEKTRTGIERRIPLGVGAFNRKLTASAEKRVAQLKRSGRDYDGVDRRWTEALGSLGSGNHFIEISLDESEQAWVVLHSGSRGVGNKLAMKHIKIAQKIMEENRVQLKDRDLAYLSEGRNEFNDYIADLLWAQDFALLNREEMMDRVMTELSFLFYQEDGRQRDIELERINCHHNFTQRENHFDENVWVTRKGAIQMKQGQKGVIPGSMGTRSYIVSGLENKMSYHSAPHGAGRRFSRTEARRRFTMDDFEKAMAGIECRHSAKLIDELPMAYKDIDEVMENSKELVKVEHTLKQIVNVKGD